ncbi:LysE family translocator [Salibaculum sp.]|uniref:LysE family translocator n=1 Tax=Salibaculum sp. TaxID=2855480 RepID=UPI002B4937F5|nr:LysE family transporter [Salibaculum sp.]HKL70944.1 LysE family transporter [Salibaculum sp.]
MAALIGFVFFGLFSPGPNVILLTASGARFGFRATLPHLFGVVLGVGITAFATGLGLGWLVQAVPALRIVLSLVAAGWILWIAWGLWRVGPLRQCAHERPMRLVEAVFFQWVNPKVWAVAVAATAHVHMLGPWAKATALALTFSGVNLFVCLFWAFAGSLLSTLMQDDRARMVFMRVMAVGLAVFSVLVFL